MITQQILDKIRSELIESGKDSRYKLDSYIFVMRSLDFYHTKAGEIRHYSGQELAKGMLEFAVKQYGPLAQDILSNWGILKTDDFGHIVYNLITVGLIKKTKDDSVYDFYNIIDFDTFFKNQKYFNIEKNSIKKIKES